MESIPLQQKALYGLISIAALHIFFVGFFDPPGMALMLDWTDVPPLHARFIGAVYLFGGLYTGGGLLAKRREQVRWTAPMIVIWTGTLGVLTLLNFNLFDLSRVSHLTWIISYLVYPLWGLWLWKRSSPAASHDPLPGWGKTYMVALGALVTLLAAAMLALPGLVANSWPWPVSALLVQVYAAPLAAMGIGSLLIGRDAQWSGVPAVALGSLGFSVAALAASGMHFALFDLSQVADLVWFTVLGLLALGSAALFWGSRTRG
jgi:hypothetical protein